MRVCGCSTCYQCSAHVPYKSLSFSCKPSPCLFTPNSHYLHLSVGRNPWATRAHFAWKHGELEVWRVTCHPIPRLSLATKISLADWHLWIPGFLSIMVLCEIQWLNPPLRAIIFLVTFWVQVQYFLSGVLKICSLFAHGVWSWEEQKQEFLCFAMANSFRLLPNQNCYFVRFSFPLLILLSHCDQR